MRFILSVFTVLLTVACAQNQFNAASTGNNNKLGAPALPGEKCRIDPATGMVVTAKDTSSDDDSVSDDNDPSSDDLSASSDDNSNDAKATGTAVCTDAQCTKTDCQPSVTP